IFYRWRNGRGGARPEGEDRNNVPAKPRARDKAGLDSCATAILRPGLQRAEYSKPRIVRSPKSCDTIPSCVLDETASIGTWVGSAGEKLPSPSFKSTAINSCRHGVTRTKSRARSPFTSRASRTSPPPGPARVAGRNGIGPELFGHGSIQCKSLV